MELIEEPPEEPATREATTSSSSVETSRSATVRGSSGGMRTGDPSCPSPGRLVGASGRRETRSRRSDARQYQETFQRYFANPRASRPYCSSTARTGMTGPAPIGARLGGSTHRDGFSRPSPSSARPSSPAHPTRMGYPTRIQDRRSLVARVWLRIALCLQLQPPHGRVRLPPLRVPRRDVAS
jgi:hypothetical protein